MTINNILNADVYREVLSYNEQAAREKIKEQLKEILNVSVEKAESKIKIRLAKINSMEKLKIAQEILRENGWRAEIHSSRFDDTYLLATLE